MSLENVMDLWMNDTSFREELGNDPDAAVQRRGLELSEEEREALKEVDWNESDEQLQQRISQSRISRGFTPSAIKKA